MELDKNEWRLTNKDNFRLIFQMIQFLIFIIIESNFNSITGER